MASVPTRVEARIITGLKRFIPILTDARNRDINESDTVLIITDILQEVFGYDKYTDITSEHAIRGTFVDLALKNDGKLVILIEVKAIGLDLKDQFVKQAVDYGSNQGIEWVVLTNGINWRVYRIIFEKPIDTHLVLEFNFLELNPKNDDHIESTWVLTKESWNKTALTSFYEQKQALNKYIISAVIRTEPVLKSIRNEIRKLSPGIKVEIDDILNVIVNDVLKREVIEGEKSESAMKVASKSYLKSLKKAEAKTSEVNPEPTESITENS